MKYKGSGGFIYYMFLGMRIYLHIRVNYKFILASYSFHIHRKLLLERTNIPGIFVYLVYKNIVHKFSIEIKGIICK